MTKEMETLLFKETPAFIDRYYGKCPDENQDEWWEKVGTATVNWISKYANTDFAFFAESIIVGVFIAVEDKAKVDKGVDARKLGRATLQRLLRKEEWAS